MLLKHYKVSWTLPGQGSYVPLGPVGEGDYYRDMCGFQIIYARSAKVARALVQAALPNAIVSGKVRVLRV